MNNANKVIVDAIRRTIKKTSITLKNGRIIYDIYCDHRDKLDGKTIRDFFIAEGGPRHNFYETISSGFDVSYTVAIEDTIQEIQKHWSSRKYPYWKHREFIENWVNEHLYIELPYKHFLDQMVCVNIVVDTGDANYEFVSNSVYPHYDGDIKDPIPNEASILWLAKQQGYTKAGLRRALKHPESTDSVLLRSLREEILNCTTHMNALVFLVQMSLEDLFIIYERQSLSKTRGAVTLGKRSRCGLYDSWSGGGSIMEITLEKDVVLPLRNIHSISPDGTESNYGVAEVYGVTSDFWTPTLLNIHHNS